MDLHALQPGYQLQEYRIEKLIGEGGFGLTYLAFDTHLEIRVAIKEYMPSDFALRKDQTIIVPKSISSKNMYEWGLNAFYEEAKMLAKFQSLNVVRVLRFFKENGTAYLVMEYCEGGTLYDRIGSKDEVDEDKTLIIMSHTKVRKLISAIVEGLIEVHNQGVLHRDIKPQNIMFRKDGTPVLIDFGAARQALSEKTRSLTSILTPGYAPIEQYSSKGKLGPWSDIYALGAVAFHCLTGNKPVDVTDRVLEDHQAKLVSLMPDACAFIGSVDWAMELKKENRPQSLVEWQARWDAKVPPKITDKYNSGIEVDSETSFLPNHWQPEQKAVVIPAQTTDSPDKTKHILALSVFPVLVGIAFAFYSGWGAFIFKQTATLDTASNVQPPLKQPSEIDEQLKQDYQIAKRIQESLAEQAESQEREQAQTNIPEQELDTIIPPEKERFSGTLFAVSDIRLIEIHKSSTSKDERELEYVDDNLNALIDIALNDFNSVVSISELNALVTKINQYMRSEGNYIVATAYLPAQEIYNGVVKLRLLRGKLDQVQVVNVSTHNEQRFSSPFDGLLQQYVRRSQVEDIVRDLEKRFKVKIKGTFMPGSKVGTTELYLEVSKAPVRSNADDERQLFDNRDPIVKMPEN